MPERKSFARHYAFDKYYYQKQLDNLENPSYNPKYDHHPRGHHKLS